MSMQTIVKRMTSLVLAVAMVVSMVPSMLAASPSDFVDFPTGWSKEAMEAAVDNGLLFGYADNEIKPKDELTRAQMAAIITRAFGAKTMADISGYVDVPSSAWYYEDIAKIVKMGGMQGKSDSVMAPEASITREEAFTIVARVLVLSSDNTAALDKFRDKAEISGWAVSSMAALAERGYINGDTLSRAEPKAHITREEFAQFMHNAIRTYITEPGTYTEDMEGITVIRVGDVVLKGLTNTSDIVIADGVGIDEVKLINVKIGNRLLARGGTITLTNTTLGGHVVVNNVNGTTYFKNYSNEIVFEGLLDNTTVKFLKKKPSSGGSTPAPGYYTVYFHNGAEEQPFDKATISRANDPTNRDLDSIGKTLDMIYQNYLGATLPAYNRSTLSSTGLDGVDVAYEHQVAKEYLYEKEPGVWEVFTNSTDVSGDVHVYYAAKRAVLAISSPKLANYGLENYSLAILYDSKSRFADSFKDALITAGSTLGKGAVKNKINAKISDAYSKANEKTGMIDASGNILDKDYGMKIVDVIDYDQIQKEVNAYIGKILDSEDPDEIEAFIAMLDISSLVENIGGRTLINTLLENETARNLFIDKVGSNNEFIVKIIDNGSFNDKIIAALKKQENSSKLLKYLDEKPDVVNEMLATIKTNKSFKDFVTGSNSSIIVSEVKASDKFKAILTGDSTYKDEIIEEIKAEKIKDMVDTLVTDKEFKKKMVAKVGDPGKKDNEKSELALKTKQAIMNIIDTDDAYAQYRNDLKITNAYEAIIQYYVEGHNDSFPNISFSRREFEEKFIPMIDQVIEKVVKEYFDYDPNDPGATKPEGYDVMKTYFDAEIDVVIDDVLIDYANGKYDNAQEGTTQYKINELIDSELSSYISQTLKDYIDPNAQMNPEVKTIIEDSLIDFVKRYISGGTLNPEIVAVMEANIISFIRDYFAGESSDSITNDPDVKALIDSVKAGFLTEIKSADPAKIKEIVDGYIGPMSDDEVDELVADSADASLIATYIAGLTPEERIELKNTVSNFLKEYKPYADFMKAFETKADTFEVNKDNAHFVRAVGQAIYGFDFDEILALLKGKGFGKLIEFFGEDVVKDMFVASKKEYWEGLEPIINEVEASGEKAYYTTSMNVTIDVPTVLRGIYENRADSFKNKIKFDEIYDYNQNEALKKLVNIDWFNVVLAYDANRVNEATGVTGYYFRDYMDYYCSMLDILILFDDALCFYDNQNYDDTELAEVKKSLSKEFLAFLDKLQSISDKIENDQPIYGDYTLQGLINKVDSLNDVVDSLAGTPLESQSANIKNVIDKIKTMLVELGQGDLPNGYTLEDLNTLCSKLENTINGMNEGEYDRINATFKDLISSAMQRLDAIITELDEDGTIAGTPVDSIISKISIINSLYNQYAGQIKKVISALAEADLGSLNIDIDAEKFEDIVFGREEDDVFNIDSVIDLVKSKLGTPGENGYDDENQVYVVDQYSKTVKGNTISLQRKFY